MNLKNKSLPGYLLTLASTSLIVGAAGYGCIPPTDTGNPNAIYAVGGITNGLDGNSTVTLVNSNNNDTLVLGSESVFTMRALLEAGESYAVSVAVQPAPPLNCTISNGTGTIVDTDVTNLVLSCNAEKYIKLSSTGDPLPASAEQWSCVQDTDTGLTWEVKTTDGGLQDATHSYTHSSDNRSYDVVSQGQFGVCYDSNGNTTNDECHTEAYVANVNAAGLCGASDWRMPTTTELKSLLTCTYPNCEQNGVAKTSALYFPNTQAASVFYWAGATSSTIDSLAEYLGFDTGYGVVISKSYGNHIRLVR
jgi:hypothetical protein